MATSAEAQSKIEAIVDDLHTFTENFAEDYHRNINKDDYLEATGDVKIAFLQSFTPHDQEGNKTFRN